MNVYIVVENGEPYLKAYGSYKAAVKAVKKKHEEYLLNWIKGMDLEMIEEVLGHLNVPEGENETLLYIEKGINIYIHKVPVD
jgi:hypothetical protein